MELNWTLFDFVIAGVLLLGTSLIYALICRKVVNTTRRILIGLGMLGLLLLIWAELAVGIFW